MKEEKQPIFKKLPRDGNGNIVSFKGEKYNYRVFRPGEPIGIVRLSVYNKTNLAFSIGQTPQMMKAVDDEIVRIAVSAAPEKDKLQEIVALALSRQRAILEKSRLRYDLALYHCTVFVVREGDDPAEWNEEMATSYLEDWRQIDENELFFFAQSISLGLNQLLKDVQAKAQKQAAVLLDTIGLKAEKGVMPLPE